ncbi:hypothetical protein [Gilliamella sp. A7]
MRCDICNKTFTSVTTFP